MNGVDAYPLQWPAGKPRTCLRKSNPFGVTLAQARDHAMKEIRMLGGRQPVVSSNMALRRDGLPYANQARIDDPGVAVYFTYKDKQHCFACDAYESVAANVRAVGKTIEALRGIARWGTGEMMEQAFRGFEALPAPESDWRDVLGVGPNGSLAAAEMAFKRLRSTTHPDKGGDADQFNKVQAAITAARLELST